MGPTFVLTAPVPFATLRYGQHPQRRRRTTTAIRRLISAPNPAFAPPDVEHPPPPPLPPPPVAVLATVTVTAADVAVTPSASIAVAVMMWLAFETAVVFHVALNGAAVIVARCASSILNSTPETVVPLGAVALALIDTELPDTVEPPVGAVIDTAGGLATVRLTAKDSLLPPSASVAIAVSECGPLVAIVESHEAAYGPGEPTVARWLPSSLNSTLEIDVP